MITIITTTEEKTFPKLMKGKVSGNIVFFTEPKKGLCFKEGRWYDNWGMEYFKDYNAPITIKNK